MRKDYEPATLKCSRCGEWTLHRFWKQLPNPTREVDPAAEKYEERYYCSMCGANRRWGLSDKAVP